MNEKSQDNIKRLVSLDVVRGMAIVYMIFSQSAYFFTPLHEQEWGYTNLYEIVHLYALFFLISGASLYFWFQKLESRQQHARVWKRVAFLTLGFMAYVWLLWGFEYMFTMELVMMLGALTIVLWAVRDFKPKYHLIFAVLIFAVTPSIQIWIDVHQYWNWPTVFIGAQISNEYEIYDWHVVLAIFFAAGWYPVFPWFGYGFAGFWFADRLKHGRYDQLLWFVGLSAFVGVVLLIANYTYFDAFWFFHYSYFPATLPNALLNAAGAGALLLGAHKFYDVSGRFPGYVGHFFYVVGQNALGFYLLGYAVQSLIFQYNIFESYLISSHINRYTFAFGLSIVLIISFYALFHRTRYEPHDSIDRTNKNRWIN